MKKIILIVLTTTIMIFLALLSVHCFVVMHYCHILEMQTQINTYGIYKEDLIMLIENNIARNWHLAGGILSIIGAVSFLCIDIYIGDNL